MKSKLGMIQSKLIKSLDIDNRAQPSQTLRDVRNYSDLHEVLTKH